MPGPQLTVATTILCPHGGQAILSTANGRIAAARAPVLLATDVPVIVGCPFTVGTKYSPCVRIEWSAGAVQVSINRTPVLVTSSIGQCLNAEGAPQGVAIIVNTQPRVTSR